MSMSTHPEIRIISNIPEFTFIEEWYELADETHFWMQWRLAAFAQQARYLNLPLDKKMLGAEIGCGQGTLGNQLSNMTSWTIEGADLDINALKRNKKQPGQLYLYNILEKNKEFEGKYDFIFLYDVLEHIEEPKPFLESCMFHLKKGGYIFINVPALEALKSEYDRVAGHYRRYNKRTLSGELSVVNCELLDIKYWGFSLVFILIIRKGVVSSKQSDVDILRKGFRPPSKLVHSLLKSLMHIETSLLRRVPVGTSVMAAAIKK